MKMRRITGYHLLVIGIAGFVLPLAIAQEKKIVTGTATYRERIALPPNAVFEATLEDVSRPGAAADVIGSARLDKPGQPPFRFSIDYDPARIVASHTYSVRARVLVDGKPMFITDQAYPVLTRGKGSEVNMLLRRASSAPGGAASNRLGALPASFSGVLPCADCPGIRYTVNLFPDNSFYLRMAYSGRGEGTSVDDIGRWALDDKGTLILNGYKDTADRFAIRSSDVLRRLDLKGEEIKSTLNYELRRTSSFERIEPRLKLSGMFRYMADAAIFSDCQSGQRWPVAMEGAYKTVEGEYLKMRRQPADDVMVNVEGQIAMRPSADGGKPTPTLVVERYIGIWPGETCGAPFSTAKLEETYWKLTRLEGKPVIVAEKQREPSLTFRSEAKRVTGSGGCNSLSGSYKLDGFTLTFGNMAATQMACMQGMETEAALLKALPKVRTWKILGQHLELYDAGGAVVARFEARALR